MSKNKISTKSIVSCALLAAVSIVMARLLCFATPDGVRWSADKFPLFLAGLLFGPVLGGLTGFTADFLGSLMQFGFNPLFCPPAILYGVFGGLMRHFIRKNPSLLRLSVSYLLPVLLGSILYQSVALASIYFDGTLWAGFLYYAGTRTIQFSIMLAVEVAMIYLLLRTKIFTRMGLWNPGKDEK